MPLGLTRVGKPSSKRPGILPCPSLCVRHRTRPRVSAALDSLVEMLCELTLAASPSMLSSIMFTGMLTTGPTCRPALITSAGPTDDVYYFGVGSNMQRSKVESRGANGPIKLRGFEAAYVRGHRLAFNLRGFAPLEPGIGSLDPCENSEAHGALIRMSAAEYEKVWLSEGGGQTDPAYEEVVVEAVPYEQGRPPVKAVALRARDHARLPHGDACPSERYMRMLISGARQLALDPSYVAALETRQTQIVPPSLHSLGVHYLFFVSALFQLNLRVVVRALSWLLWRAYVPSDCKSDTRRAVGNCATAMLLAPGAAVGWAVRTAMWLFCIAPPPMLAAYAKIRPGCPGACS